MLDEYKYPFVKTAEAELKRVYGPSIGFYDILTSDNDLIQEAKERINETVRLGKAKPYLNLRNPVLLFYTSLLVLAVINEADITSKYIQAEVEMFSKLMEKETESDLLSLSNVLGFKASYCDPLRYHQDKTVITLSLCSDLISYVRASKGTEAKLSRQILLNGKVYFTKRALVAILRKKLKVKIGETLRPLRISLPKTLEDMIKGVSPTLPPCIKRIRERSEMNEEERRILDAYLVDVGETTRSSKNVIVYSCEIMKKKGLCVAECGVKNPLQLIFGRKDGVEPLNHSNEGEDIKDVKQD